MPSPNEQADSMQQAIKENLARMRRELENPDPSTAYNRRIRIIHEEFHKAERQLIRDHLDGKGDEDMSFYERMEDLSDTAETAIKILRELRDTTIDDQENGRDRPDWIEAYKAAKEIKICGKDERYDHLIGVITSADIPVKGKCNLLTLSGHDDAEIKDLLEIDELPWDGEDDD